jgi:NADPH:quinone reductase-like Zn-dependent oxidoreductase
MGATMRAVVIREFGGPEVLRLEEVERPQPGPGEVLIEVAAVSVNRTLDLVVRAGRYARRVELPHVLGADPTGTIVALGPGVTRRRLGERVAVAPHLTAATAERPPVLLGVQAWGGYAEYVVVPADKTYLLPDALDFPTATVIARHAPLAFNMLVQKAVVRPGEWVLVMGASGGLGSTAVQVAAMLGAQVIGAAGSPERAAAATRLGASHGIDYRAEDLTARVRAITGGRGVDVVLENVGDPELFKAAFAAIGRHGRLVTAGAHAGGEVPLDLRHLYLNYITISGTTAQTDEDVERSLAAAASGAIRAVIDQVLPLSEAPEAHRRVARRATLGKVILSPLLDAP